MLATPATAQLAQSLGNPEGCARIDTGQSVDKTREMTIVAGHLNLYGDICMITAIQANTLMLTCPGEKESRKKVFGIARNADGAGVTITLENGRIEELRPCD
ncbi:MAG: hypothetical protein NXH74_02135 [Rhodobacteraceae bacterium]|nr:hypothetical protein [Paracoccaceae bacterium]